MTDPVNASRARRLRSVLLTIVVALVAIQFVPYGRAHDNPPVSGEPAWDSPRTEDLARRACFDCHSNETEWPWYSSIAPLSWRIQNHVDEGRAHLNFSTPGRGLGEANEAADALREGEMPLFDYVLAHPRAQLDDAETRALIDGLTRTFASEPGDARGTRDVESDEHREGH